MPQRPMRQCTYPGCGTLTQGKRARCEKHPEKAWEKYGKQVKRITGNTLIKLRKELFAEEPLCVECKKNGRVSLATQRDHIQPLGEDGTEEKSNTQGLCQECHDRKSEEERKRGRKR